ncbi:MAG: hypothetical protein GF331_02010 [Chitinivibrionales bacterium]|nr:hypothetical protein [Chitinivibrionales bacterium]
MSHACGGDPSAFLTLLGPRLAATYDALRTSDSTGESRDQLLTFASHVYRRLTAGRFRRPLDEWYNAESARTFPSLEPPAEPEGASLDTELAHALEQAIQREYSALLRARGPRRGGAGTASSAGLRRGVFIGGGAVLLLAVVAAILQPIWSRTGTRIELRLTTGERAYGVAFPFGSGITPPSPREASIEDSAQTDTRADSAQADSAADEASVARDAPAPKQRPEPRKPAIVRRDRSQPAPAAPSRPAAAAKPEPKPATQSAPPPAPAPKPTPTVTPEPSPKPQPETVVTPEPASTPKPPPPKPSRDQSAETAESPGSGQTTDNAAKTPVSGDEAATDDTETESGLGDLDFSEWPSDGDSETPAAP